LGIHYESDHLDHFHNYCPFFKVYQHDVSPQALSYLNGLLRCERGKANIERIEEIMQEFEYHHYQHFLSNSPWDHTAVIAQVRRDSDAVMGKERVKHQLPTGLIVDESAHPKRGDKSVGVARQYAGEIGKVDNCQVGVYASLVTGNCSCLVDERLYLPKEWIEDKERCELAAVPESERIFKTKPQLALEIIDQSLREGIHFDWVGGDGLYGHTYELAKGLEDRKLLFVLDIHKDQHVYLTHPDIILPEKSPGRGRIPTRLKASLQPVRVDQYVANLGKHDWQKVTIRKACKGYLRAWIHIATVWVWDGEERCARQRSLIVRQDIHKKNKKGKIKYSLSNGSKAVYSTQQFAYFQAQRYWVERDFQSGKSELGMSDYQIRKWRGWHHHHAIVLMAMLFNLKERIKHEVNYPLMSVRDARILVSTLIAQTMLSDEPQMAKELRLMQLRHRKRQFDIDRHYLEFG
jgi:SRSO17 transposase